MVNLFCLGGLYKLVLGSGNSADQTQSMPDQFIRSAMSVPDDMNRAFKVRIDKLATTNLNHSLKHSSRSNSKPGTT